MAIEWQLARVGPPAPHAIPPLDRPSVTGLYMVGHVMCWTRAGRCTRGSGFVVHPHAVVSVAHVVAPWDVTGPLLPVSACVDLVLKRFVPSRVALPAAWLEECAADADVAVLWFDEPICGPERPLALARLEGTRSARVWGSPRGRPWSIAIEARGAGGELEGVPGEEVPRGFSGGPWTASVTAAQNDQTVIGIERISDSAERGLAPPIEDLDALLGRLAAPAEG